MNAVKTKQLTVTAVFAALTFAATFVFHIPTGVAGGYIHVGDAIIYLAACILPRPFAFAASAIGAGLSDLFTPGAAVWILPTIIIKPLCCALFKNDAKIFCKRNAAALVFSALVTMLGYGAATAVITGNVITAVFEMPFQLIQSAASSACFLVLAAMLDKIKLKTLIGF